MSIFNRIYRAALSLLFPQTCPVCGGELLDGERFVCTACRFRVPLTGYASRADNAVAQMFWGMIPVEQASAFMFYVEGSPWRRLIHDFKYHDRWLFARRMGEWYGGELRASGLYAQIDTVVAVPLHWRKRLSRGYNQSEYLARGIARQLGARCEFGAVRRVVNNPSQARSRRSERWDNVENIFRVVHAEALAGRHILIVDDVLTTGATICSCAAAIVAAVPDAHISIAALAVSRRTVGEV